MPPKPDAPIDFGKTAADYGRYRAGFPDQLYDRLSRFAVGLPGQRLLDLGCGTGGLSRGFARRGCDVTGLDRSQNLLDEAKRLDAAAGLSVHYVMARAEDTGLDTSSFDVVTAGQCWHWFDRPAAVLEARRVLKPGGALVLAHFDWIPLPGNVVEATERLIEKHNPAWKLGGGSGVHAWALADLATAGFIELETFSFDLMVPYTHEAWRGRIRASAGVGATLPPEAVERFDRDHTAMLRARFPGDPLPTHHRTFAIVARAPRT
jgi:ubiquinone/menaquinone biosynthesis C-methylase UbiE